MEHQEKPKNKQYVTEWSFSFDDLGDKIGEFVKSFGVSGNEQIRTETFTAPLGSATSARVRLDIPVAETVVNDAVGTDSLIDAEITHIGEIQFSVTGDQERTISLSQKTQAADWVRGIVGWIGTQGKLAWNVGLTPSIPLNLEINTGVGKSTFDLRNLHLTALDINGGTGEVLLTLPIAPDHLRAVFNAGVGSFNVRVPAGTSTDLYIHTGTGEVDLTIEDGAAVNATIKGGVGQCDVKIPAGAAARVHASMGLGEVNLPPQFVRVSGEGSFGIMGTEGTWETAGYATAERKITITYEGGVGELVVR